MGVMGPNTSGWFSYVFMAIPRIYDWDDGCTMVYHGGLRKPPVFIDQCEPRAPELGQLSSWEDQQNGEGPIATFHYRRVIISFFEVKKF